MAEGERIPTPEEVTQNAGEKPTEGELSPAERDDRAQSAKDLVAYRRSANAPPPPSDRRAAIEHHMRLKGPREKAEARRKVILETLNRNARIKRTG